MILQTATTTLLEPYDLEGRQLERIFGTLAARKVDYADLYFQYSRSEGWSLEEGIVKSGSFNIEQGVGVRAVSGEKTAFAYSDEISFDALEDAAKATRAIASAGQARVVKAGSRKLPTPLYAAVDPIASLPSEAKVAPVLKDDLSDARNTIIWAISSGIPARLSGTPATKPAFFSAVPVKRSSMPVSMGPGATTLTRTPNSAASRAADCVSPSTACLLAA